MESTITTGDFVVKRLDALSYFDVAEWGRKHYLAVVESITSEHIRLTVYCDLDLFESVCPGDVVEISYDNKHNVVSWESYGAVALT